MKISGFRDRSRECSRLLITLLITPFFSGDLTAQKLLKPANDLTKFNKTEDFPDSKKLAYSVELRGMILDDKTT